MRQALWLSPSTCSASVDRAEHMIERRRRDGGDQRVAVAVELIVPAARDGMAEIMPLQARQRRARFVGGARLARLGLRDPRLGDFGLRPQPPLCRLILPAASPSSTRQPVASSR